MLISETGLGSRARAGGELEPPKARPRGQIGSPPRCRSRRKNGMEEESGWKWKH